MLAMGLILGLALGLGLFALRARLPKRGAPGTRAQPVRASAPDAAAAIGALRLRASAAIVTERLWRHAFGAGEAGAALPPEHARIGEIVQRSLKAEQLDDRCFPRRPNLMPQLLRTVNDPDASPAALSGIVAQDPVLAGDVLKLANSAMYRVSSEPVETIQRAIVVCGIDGLQSLVAAALMQPVFRATEDNFPRFPELLWERSSRAARIAELYAARTRPKDRFEAQLVALLAALGPLAVYRVALDRYATRKDLDPSPELFVELIGAMGARVARRVARNWNSSERICAALDQVVDEPGPEGEEPLSVALAVGELFATLTVLVERGVYELKTAQQFCVDAGLEQALVATLWARLSE
jgi:HD-like signal output (HDOD) protein